MGAVDLDPKFVQPETFDIADDPDRGNDRVELFRLGLAALLDMGRDLALAAVQLGHRRFLADLHALLFELLLGECRNLGILNRQHAVHDLDHRRVGPERVEETREFDPDGPRPDDQKLLRHPRGLERVLVGPDQIPVGFEPRKGARPRARGEDDVLRRQRLGPLVGLDRDLTLGGDRPLAHDDRHLVLLEQVRHAAGKLLGHAPRPLHDRVQIIARLFDRQAEILGPVHEVIDLGRPQKRLGRNAAPVEADTAQMLTLHHRDLQAQLRRPDRGHVAPRTGADHDHVKAGLSHRYLPREKVVYP